jgi:hypothetical protein
MASARFGERDAEVEDGVVPFEARVPLIAAGGVNQQTAASYILSGATAIGAGTELIPIKAIEKRQSQCIHELARRFLKLVGDAREQLELWKRSLVVKEFTDAEKCEK